jgi:hypothetical protein
MSKKLIAVAAAAALALSALVSIPASGYGLSSIAVDNYAAGNNTGATASPFLTTVPDDDSLDISSGSTTGDLVRVTVSPAKGQKVSVSTTGAVKLIDEPTDADNEYTVKSGLSSWDKTAENVTSPADIVFYAFTTSTTAGTFSVTVGDSGSTTYYLKAAKAGAPYKISATFPTSLATSGTADVLATVVDAFGNAITTGTSPITAGITGAATLKTAATGYATYITAKKAWLYVIEGAETAGNVAVNLAIATPDPDDVFGTPVLTAFGTIGSASLADQVKALTAQVAALTADYNALAAKWNKKAKKKKNKVALK